jgi:hypothetical protein
MAPNGQAEMHIWHPIQSVSLIITLFNALSRDMALFGHAARQGGFSQC